MELPIDHFRLLGVVPTTDAQSVLHKLQKRIDRPPSQGFTPETLQARADLLRASADLLTDSERRLAYETELVAISEEAGASIAALDVPSAKELGGMLLLLEAGQPLECFELASRNLQPPQAPSLGSSREADLTLLTGLACLAAGADLHTQRRYEAAAQTLQQGLQVIQRMGKFPALRQQISDEIEGLTPFRVLDLLSRNLTATNERAAGMALLDDLVKRRGGLEGQADLQFNREEFQAFFKQIRAFLTVQEQIDLFSRWADDPQMPRSSAADFLATTALTASGFAQRKPERIAAAQQRLKASNTEGSQPLEACLHLLLGEVEQGRAAFKAGASDALKQWAADPNSDTLAQLCTYCSDWLSRDVLPGYRDLEADADLEAYFADRDVQAYVERHAPQNQAQTQPTPQEKRSLFGAASELFKNPFEAHAAPHPNPDNPGEISGLAGLGDIEALGDPGDGLKGDAGLTQKELIQEDLDEEDLDDDLDHEPWFDAWVPRWRLPASWPPSWPNRQQWGAGAAGLVIAVAAGVVLRHQSQPTPIATPTPKPAPPAAPKPAPAGPLAAFPLTAVAPRDGQVRALLESWLAAKAAVLAGQSNSLPLEAMASPLLIERLQTQRAADGAMGSSKRISARITGFKVANRDAKQIVATVEFDYSETPLNRAGSPSGPPSKVLLRNRYVFGLDGQRWLLVDYAKAPN